MAEQRGGVQTVSEWLREHNLTPDQVFLLDPANRAYLYGRTSLPAFKQGRRLALRRLEKIGSYSIIAIIVLGLFGWLFYTLVTPLMLDIFGVQVTGTVTNIYTTTGKGASTHAVYTYR